MNEQVGHHFELEHKQPHCFACRKPIEIGALVLIQRLENAHVWWHQECAPDSTEDERSNP